MTGPWTDAEIKSAREMWSAGRSAGEIAKALGRSRCSVIGKISRLKLRRNEAAVAVTRRAAATAPRLAWRADETDILRRLIGEGKSLNDIRGRLGRSKTSVHRKIADLGLAAPQPRPAQGKALKFGAPVSPTPTAPILPTADSIPSDAIPWNARTGRECNFPIGDTRDGGLFCCPADRLPGHSYCAHHACQPGLYVFRAAALKLVAA